METTYREKLENRQLTNEEIGVVVKSTAVLLRRHNVDETLCPRCGNNDPDACRVTKVDGAGFITEVECQVCQLPKSTICHHPHCRYESIEDPSILRPGDHVSWHRPYLIWHHAVVTEQDLVNKEITVYEYTLSGTGPYAAIVATKLPYAKCTSFRSGALYRVVYDDSYTDQYSVLRATKSLGEIKYDIFEKNCEHSTRWCKTGVHDSDQMEVCFTTAGKTAIIVFLRLISLVMLWLLQLSHEQQSVKRQKTQERIINAVYMAFIACVFFAYSLYHSGKWIQPTVSEESHDTDICGIESGRRKCADVTYEKCCCRSPKCEAVVMTLCCASCFFCSLCDACCSVCRKNIQCGGSTICRRPSNVVIGLFIRILVRETIAAAGPLLVLFYEEEVVSYFGDRLAKSVVIILAIIAASVVAYLVGALIGVWIEAVLRCCATCCCSRSAAAYGGENTQPAKEEMRLMGNSNE